MEREKGEATRQGERRRDRGRGDETGGEGVGERVRGERGGGVRKEEQECGRERKVGV